jgi:hypothetical protein
VELTEPDGSISDIVVLHIVGNSTTMTDQSWTLKFFSDNEGTPLQPFTCLGTVPCVTIIPETGGLQDISGDFFDSNGRTRINPLFTVKVQPDSDVVPEPRSVILIAIGALGLFPLLRRR